MRAGHYCIPAIFEHVRNANAWSTLQLLDKANSIIDVVNALAEGRTLNSEFIQDRNALVHHGELSQPVEEALARILQAADVEQRRINERTTPPYPWGYFDSFPNDPAGSSGEPAEKRGLSGSSGGLLEFPPSGPSQLVPS